jgi:hypothetical protein
MGLRGTQIIGSISYTLVNHHSRKISCEEEILESIIGCKHPLIASGATTIGSSRRALDEIKQKNNAAGKMRRQNTWAYTQKKFDYSLGGYYHREH